MSRSNKSLCISRGLHHSRLALLLSNTLTLYSMKHHFNIKVFGKVHGVCFRAESQKKAKTLKLTGFVCNEPDGSLYIEAEGELDSLEEFLNWCRVGPSAASVSKIESEPEDELENYTSFDIKYK